MFRVSLPSIGAVQIVAVMTMLAALTFWPPASGAMIIVPLTRASQASLLNLALGHKATLLGEARVAGLLIVNGDRETLAPAFWNARALLVAAPSPLCSTRGGKSEGASS
ncbi:hypothetical protein H5J25_15610 [Sphingomonas aliaeris]|uniref:Uncharacterized protein n=1 Tax=Sphingomonas aliaeris TaxID=2759526 RepID=A0A974S3R0_9SPHN|nr:hypothetical protein [Sphingomonas aliaeris]QQV76813.1 hypothetical protein H5J25_15610 [Sphingomonas aliaeris]